MNIYDIAKKAGVSSATVSRVINGSVAVSASNRAKVQKVMEQEDFTPNIFARGLNLNSIKTVGVICPVIRDVNHASLVHIIEELLRKNGFDCLLCCINSNLDEKGSLIGMLFNKRVDAIIIIGSTPGEQEDTSAFTKISAHIPIIVINGLIEAENVYSILSDEYHIVYEIVKKWIDAGLRHILYIYDSLTFSGQQKKAGYLDALRDHGLEADKRYILHAEDGGEPAITIERTRALTSAVMEAELPVDALIAADDLLAIAAQKVLLTKGIRVSVVGFNDSSYARLASPELSSVNIMSKTLCSAAVSTLMQVLGKEEAAAKILISCELVERESSRFN